MNMLNFILFYLFLYQGYIVRVGIDSPPVQISNTWVHIYSMLMTFRFVFKYQTTNALNERKKHILRDITRDRFIEELKTF